MSRYFRRATAAAVLALGTLASSAHAELIDRGNGLIYDTTMNITWLSDFNYAQTSGYSPDGRMTQSEAQAWAEQLSYGGFDDWRLPTSNFADTHCSHTVVPIGGGPTIYTGYNCIGSEMGHLHYVDFGGQPDGEMADGTNHAQLALFTNIQRADPDREAGAYWTSGIPYPSQPGIRGVFWTFVGSQGYDFNTERWWAVAVRDGDVLAVPEPASAATMGLGLCLLLMAARRRSTAQS